jgi:uncharacterized protein YerC
VDERKRMARTLRYGDGGVAMQLRRISAMDEIA